MSKAPLNIGGRKQLLLDEWLFQAARGVELCVNPPADAGVAVEADRPWEAAYACEWCVVVPDEKLGHVKMYYEACSPKPVGSEPWELERHLCCAVSTDGVSWEKPDLGVCQFDGSKANNIVFQAEVGTASADGIALGDAHGKRAYDQVGSVVVDENDVPERRYKMLFCGGECKMRAAYSPDGFDWTVLNDWKPVSDQGADSGNIFFWDDAVGKWVGYFRMWDSTRRVSRVETDDWTCWPDRTVENVVLSPDELDSYDEYLDAPCFRPGEFIDKRLNGLRYDPYGPQDKFVWLSDDTEKVDGVDFYNQPVTKYPFADQAYVMPFTAFQHRPNLQEIRLAVSRDGINWTRPGDRQAWIRPPVDRFIGEMYCGPGVVRRGSELFHYHSSMSMWHGWGKPGQYEMIQPEPYTGSIRRVTLRLDGYVSVDAGNLAGGFVTPPMVFQGEQLLLNVDTGASGWVKVELVREHGDPIWGYRINGHTLGECDPIVCNATSRVVTWKGNADVSGLAGKPVRMHVRMRNARLYAFQFTCDSSSACDKKGGSA